MPPSSATSAQRPQAAPVPATPPRADVLGIPLALADYERTMDWLDSMVQSDANGYVTTAAEQLAAVAHEDPETRAAVLNAPLAVPDRQPVVSPLQAAKVSQPPP